MKFVVCLLIGLMQMNAFALNCEIPEDWPQFKKKRDQLSYNIFVESMRKLSKSSSMKIKMDTAKGIETDIRKGLGWLTYDDIEELLLYIKIEIDRACKVPDNK